MGSSLERRWIPRPSPPASPPPPAALSTPPPRVLHPPRVLPFHHRVRVAALDASPRCRRRRSTGDGEALADPSAFVSADLAGVRLDRRPCSEKAETSWWRMEQWRFRASTEAASSAPSVAPPQPPPAKVAEVLFGLTRRFPCLPKQESNHRLELRDAP